MSQAAVKSKIEINMTKGKLLPKMIRFALPLIAMSVLQLLFNSADMIVVGQFDSNGDAAISAIGSTTSVVNLLVNFFIGLSVGAGVVMSRCYGAKDAEKGERVLHTSMLLGLLSGVLIAILGACLTKTILTFMKCPASVYDLAFQYLLIYFLGSPFNLVYNFGAAILRSVGDTLRPLIYLIIAGVLNVIVNLITVIFLDMSVMGVALATITSQAVSATLVVVTLIKNKGFAVLSLKKIRFNKAELMEVLRFGIPSGIQSSLFAITNVLTQSTINVFGETVMAGNSAAVNIGGYVFTTMQAVGNTSATVVGQNYGAKDFKRIKRAVWLSLAIVATCGLTVGIIGVIFAKSLLGLYTSTPEALECGLLRLSIMLPTYFIAGLMDVCNHSLRGIGYSVTPMLIALIGTCFMRLGWIFGVYPVWESVLPIFGFSGVYTQAHRLTCIFLSWPITWLITFVTAAIFLAVLLKKRAKKYSTELAAEERTAI